MSVQGWDENAQLPYGATFAQGYNFELPYYGVGQSVNYDLIQGEIEGCLYNTHNFDDLRISFPSDSSYFYSGANLYIQIDGRTAETFGKARDLQDLITGTLQQCLSLAVKGAFPLVVLSVPRIDQSTGQSVDQSTGVYKPNPELQNPVSKCPSGQIDRGFIYGCQPTQCPPGQVYEEGFLSAGCVDPNKRGLFDSLGFKAGAGSAVAVIGLIFVGVLLIRR